MVDTPGTAFTIANVVIPKSGPKTVPCRLDFTGVDSHQVDLSQLVETSKIEYVQTIFIDNYSNPNPLIVRTDLTNQRIVVPAGSQGYYSVLQPNPPKITFETTAGAFNVYLQFLNVPVQPCVWDTSAGAFTGLTDTELRASPVDVNISSGGGLTDAELRATPVDVATGLVQALTDAQLAAHLPLGVTGPLTDAQLAAHLPLAVTGPLTDAQLAAHLPLAVTGPLTDAQLRATEVPVLAEIKNNAYTDRSRALTGASVVLAAALATRRLLIVQNPNAVNPIAINLTGGAAVLNGAGSLTIPAGGVVVLDTVAPTGGINVIGTNLDTVVAWEA